MGGGMGAGRSGPAKAERQPGAAELRTRLEQMADRLEVVERKLYELHNAPPKQAPEDPRLTEQRRAAAKDAAYRAYLAALPAVDFELELITQERVAAIRDGDPQYDANEVDQVLTKIAEAHRAEDLPALALYLSTVTNFYRRRHPEAFVYPVSKVDAYMDAIRNLLREYMLAFLAADQLT
ncbi:hypothetical protein Sros01_72190 [Streptomyces roseochromogenus]|nr:hypothetical protein Sros01_72190 [Streptomyces roseochromogenus]